MSCQFQVVGSLRPIVASLGADVVLPCRVEPPLDVAALTVEWSRPDLQPDPRDRLSRVEYVHLRRDNHEVPDMKISSFVRRTALFVDGLRRGDISLMISNVTAADEGRFRCFVPKLKSRVRSSVVHLLVETNSAENWTTETPPQTRSLQTPDLTGEADVKGDSSCRSRLTLVVAVLCNFFVILGFGVTTCLLQNWRKQEVTAV
ncbi:selection and upkeep of intraepithelial T-cells protein 2-like [Clinocottus analis]|uniref:selection and upkeep of intraepithelial T-cells protein 2-like n=1 Tax=Clinocottus analis TaxID=304258 RepID=UPI0035C03A82